MGFLETILRSRESDSPFFAILSRDIGTFVRYNVVVYILIIRPSANSYNFLWQSCYILKENA